MEIVERALQINVNYEPIADYCTKKHPSLGVAKFCTSFRVPFPKKYTQFQ